MASLSLKHINKTYPNGFEAVNYLDSIGAIVGNADSSRIEFIEAIEGVAWVEKNPA